MPRSCRTPCQLNAQRKAVHDKTPNNHRVGLDLPIAFSLGRQEATQLREMRLIQHRETRVLLQSVPRLDWRQDPIHLEGGGPIQEAFHAQGRDLPARRAIDIGWPVPEKAVTCHVRVRAELIPQHVRVIRAWALQSAASVSTRTGSR